MCYLKTFLGSRNVFFVWKEEEKIKKNLGRKIIIILLAILFFATTIYKLNIEPADYKKSLSDKVTEANEMLKDIKIGNGNGEYSNYNVIEFNNALKVAKEILKNDDSYYDIEKAAYKNLNEAIDKFKDSKNSNSISKSEVKTLKVKSSKKSKVVKLGNKNSVTWNISGDKINSPNDINLDVSESPDISSALFASTNLILDFASLSVLVK